jgi:hypothetical protein
MILLSPLETYENLKIKNILLLVPSLIKMWKNKKRFNWVFPDGGHLLLLGS